MNVELERLRDCIGAWANADSVAAFACGWLAAAAERSLRMDLSLVTVRWDFDEGDDWARVRAEALRGFLVELGHTLPSELEELAREVLRLVEAACRPPSQT